MKASKNIILAITSFLILILATAQKKPEKELVKVSTVDELIAAIDSNKTIYLADGIFNLSQLKSENNSHVTKDLAYESGYWIHDVSNLTLRGAPEGNTQIVLDSRYENVFAFFNAKNINIVNITFGHTKGQPVCQGGVMITKNCQNIKFKNCKLFGCGTIGLAIKNSKNVEFVNSEIYECTSFILDIKYSNNVSFNNSLFYNNGACIAIANSDNINFNKC
ncbi:MAG: right-handed parallel beta-helix repeat-containing protein, partial [Bacteroidia bacterium]|nr:right-handed parallel beta-helix repeat-containing protein [Bacteroidia bacterium]